MSSNIWYTNTVLCGIKGYIRPLSGLGSLLSSQMVSFQMFVHNQAGTLHAHKTARKTPAIKYLPGQFFSNQQIKVLLSAMGTIQAWQHQVGNIKAGRLDKINACTYSTAANMRASLQLQLSVLAAFLLSASLLFIKLDISKLSVSSTCDRDVGIQVTQLNNPSFFCLR